MCKAQPILPSGGLFPLPLDDHCPCCLPLWNEGKFHLSQADPVTFLFLAQGGMSRLAQLPVSHQQISASFCRALEPEPYLQGKTGGNKLIIYKANEN